MIISLLWHHSVKTATSTRNLIHCFRTSKMPDIMRRWRTKSVLMGFIIQHETAVSEFEIWYKFMKNNKELQNRVEYTLQYFISLLTLTWIFISVFTGCRFICYVMSQYQVQWVSCSKRCTSGITDKTAEEMVMGILRQKPSSHIERRSNTIKHMVQLTWTTWTSRCKSMHM